MSAPVTGGCANCGAAVEENGSNFVHLSTGKHVCSNPRDHGIHFAELETPEAREAELERERNESYAAGEEAAQDEASGEIARLEELAMDDDQQALVRDGHELRAHLAPYLGCTADVSGWQPQPGRNPHEHPYTVWMDANYPIGEYELAELVLMVYQLKPEHKEN